MATYPEVQSRLCFLEQANLVMTAIFTLEMVFKLAGDGWTQYSKDFFNVFDGAVVIVGLVELAIAFSSSGTFVGACSATQTSEDSGGSAISALRSFRLFRVFKLARGNVKLQRLLKVIVSTW